MFYNFRKNKKAFTLVELIVVIAIIAILGAVVGVTVTTFVNRARKSAATSPLTELADKWKLNDGKSLNDYIIDLFEEDDNYKNFSCNNETMLGKSDFGTTTFKIFYHDDNSGSYWGVLEVKAGVVSKKNVSTQESDPKAKAVAKPAS